MVPSVSSKEQGEDVLHAMTQRFQLPMSKITHGKTVPVSSFSN